MNNNYCSSCKVNVSKELRHCPLCGKFVGNTKDETSNKEESSYPKVDMRFIAVERWIKLVRSILVLFGIVSVAVNIFFKSGAYWFPYARSRFRDFDIC